MQPADRTRVTDEMLAPVQPDPFAVAVAEQMRTARFRDRPAQAPAEPSDTAHPDGETDGTGSGRRDDHSGLDGATAPETVVPKTVGTTDDVYRQIATTVLSRHGTPSRTAIEAFAGDRHLRAAVDAARADLAAELAKARREIETAHAVAVSNKRALGAAFEAQEQAEAERDQARAELAQLRAGGEWEWGADDGATRWWATDEAQARRRAAQWQVPVIRRWVGDVETITEETP